MARGIRLAILAVAVLGAAAMRLREETSSLAEKGFDYGWLAPQGYWDNDHVYMCPIGNNTETATPQVMNSDLNSRVAAWQAEFNETLRLYQPGVENPGERFCNATLENKYCQFIAGGAGDAIPQDGTYCLWAVLEFQDKPGFFEDDTLSKMFDSHAISTLNAVGKKATLDKPQVRAYGTAAGACRKTRKAWSDAASSPWAVSSVIWENGNKWAKDWVHNFHRPTQCRGLSWGFVLHGHYKAVKCQEIDEVFQKYNVTLNSEKECSLGNGCSFSSFWNAFSSIKDYSSNFLGETECRLGPCS